MKNMVNYKGVSKSIGKIEMRESWAGKWHFGTNHFTDNYETLIFCCSVQCPMYYWSSNTFTLNTLWLPFSGVENTVAVYRLRYIEFHARASHFFIRSDGPALENYFQCSGLSFLFHDHEYTLNSFNISLALCSFMSTITFEHSCVILNTLSSNIL